MKDAIESSLDELERVQAHFDQKLSATAQEAAAVRSASERAASAKSAVTCAACSRGRTSTWTVTTSAVSELRNWIRAPAVDTSLALSTSAASSTPKVSLAGMSHASPPSKSTGHEVGSPGELPCWR